MLLHWYSICLVTMPMSLTEKMRNTVYKNGSFCKLIEGTGFYEKLLCDILLILQNSHLRS